jgi:hypothetical protein
MAIFREATKEEGAMARWPVVLAILVSLTCSAQDVKSPQAPGLSISGKMFRIGMAKSEALRLAPPSEVSKPSLHSMTLAEDDDSHFILSQGDKLLGGLDFVNNQVSCVRSDEGTFLGSDKVSKVIRVLLDMAAHASGGGTSPITLSTATKTSPNLTIDEIRLSKPPYEYRIAWAHPGFPESAVTFSISLGACRPGK